MNANQKYKLFNLLNECGYKPSEENLNVLLENPEYINILIESKEKKNKENVSEDEKTTSDNNNKKESNNSSKMANYNNGGGSGKRHLKDETIDRYASEYNDALSTKKAKKEALEGERKAAKDYKDGSKKRSLIRTGGTIAAGLAGTVAGAATGNWKLAALGAAGGLITGKAAADKSKLEDNAKQAEKDKATEDAKTDYDDSSRKYDDKYNKLHSGYKRNERHADLERLEKEYEENREKVNESFTVLDEASAEQVKSNSPLAQMIKQYLAKYGVRFTWRINKHIAAAESCFRDDISKVKLAMVAMPMYTQMASVNGIETPIDSCEGTRIILFLDNKILIYGKGIVTGRKARSFQLSDIHDVKIEEGMIWAKVYIYYKQRENSREDRLALGRIHKAATPALERFFNSYSNAHFTKEFDKNDDNYLKEDLGIAFFEDVDLEEDLSDYELYQCLDEAGYIPSKENLNILLDEDYRVLDEGLIKAIRKHRNRKKAKKRMKQMWKDGKAGPQIKKAQATQEEKEENPALEVVENKEAEKNEKR